MGAQVNKMIREIVAKGITKIKEIIEIIRKKLLPQLEYEDKLDIEELVTCEDVLAEKVCTALRTAAEKLKIKVEEIDALVREAVKQKITDAKEILKFVREKIVELAKAECKDIIPEWVCTKIHSMAEKLKIKVAAVDKFIRELVARGITKLQEIIAELKKHF